MQKRKWKRIALWSGGVFLGLVVILAVHIWWVMRPRIDGNSRVMARIDLHQGIGQQDADSIRAWLYRQRGVRHALVNPASQIAVFSYAPLENDGNRIVADFRSATVYKNARRFMPSPDAAASGCPVASTSFAYKLYAFMKKTL